MTLLNWFFVHLISILLCHRTSYFCCIYRPQVCSPLSISFLGGSDSKESACQVGDLGLIPGLGRSPGGGHSNLLQYSCWRIPWTEEPGELQSMGSQRVGHDWATKHSPAQLFKPLGSNSGIIDANCSDSQHQKAIKHKGKWWIVF